MCRHLGYLGDSRTLHELLFAPEYGLLTQAYAPRMNRSNILNADGFGAGWYDAARDAPVRYRRAQPMWTDLSFADVADVVRTRCAVAAVRSATVGFPVDESCAQPFTDGQRLFSHNGAVEGFAGVEAKLRELAGDLSPVPDARAPIDSALLFAMAAAAWRTGASLGEGLAHVVRSVTPLTGGRFNLLATDGTRLAATTWGDTLFVRSGPGVVIASEPYDDEPGWEEVPDRSLVTAGPGGVGISPI
ncbi:ergothioneine biosynthesis protein EgtC [Actinoallomurus iriomotensis]|uniref:Gamma-glutamyl-hercynylcysteine sulfoxide hydrolase n=1 Tax=Actinoallomurus iriomotensis TaxID=478107 RepID=A0A9W6RF95_9ACTN|nr:ergothioneine biosynthesis protein EgtC [Actinoallomurus iriomotensis]GLY72972.1 gamma-glutamyl-hercynylcysteine sulfoxide hydrolase [Actinoallomurus iriomotensis]